MSELTPAQKEAYARASTSAVDLFSMELRHSTFPQPIRLITYDKPVMVELEDYAPANPGEDVEFMGVAFKAPEENIDTEPGNSLTVHITGISSLALPYLSVAQETAEPIACSVRYVTLDTRGDFVIGVSRPLDLQVRSFILDVLAAKISLGYTNLASRTLDV